MDFNLSDDQKQIKETAKKIAQRELAPKAAEIDNTGAFPWEGVKKLAEADLLGLAVPSEFGGVDVDTLSFVLVIEEIAKACASTGLIAVSHAAACKSILIGGNEEQRKNHLPPLARGESLGAFAIHEAGCGSIAAALETKAEAHGDNYLVNGSKIFITSAKEADTYLVLVRTNPSKGPQGLSMLVVDKDTPGFSFGRIDERMGLRGVCSRELTFQDCSVPKKNLVGQEGEGLQIVGQAIVGFAFLGAAAISLGIAQAALDVSVKHAKERVIAGNPIGANQGVQYLTTEMSLAVDTARYFLYWAACGSHNNPLGSPIAASKAKLYASEMAVEVTEKALQIHGGHGYCKELPVERYYRDARGLTLHFKTTELLKQDIGKALIGV